MLKEVIKRCIQISFIENTESWSIVNDFEEFIAKE
jgi:hypothetical protein